MHWLDVLFPSGLCALCSRPLRASGIGACRSCIRRLCWNVPPWCQSCGRPWRARHTSLCHYCSNYAPPFQSAFHLAVYDDTMRQHLHRLKFGQRRGIARPLGTLLAQRWRRHGPWPRQAVVVPVPLHARRLQKRGYNQAALLAQSFATQAGWPLVHNVLRRNKYTMSQARLPVQERFDNVAGAFAVSSPAPIQNRHVVIIDDVFTTGATCTAAAQALLKAGARHVSVACVGVAVINRDVHPLGIAGRPHAADNPGTNG